MRLLTRCPLAQEDDVGHHGGAFPFEGVGWKADRTEEVRTVGEVFAGDCVLAVQGVVACDDGQHAAGLESIHGFAQEVVVQAVLLTPVLQLHVGEGDIPDDGVQFGQAGVAEILDADVVTGVQRLGDPAGDAVEFNPDEAVALRGMGHEIADTCPRLQYMGMGRYAKAAQSFVHGIA